MSQIVQNFLRRIEKIFEGRPTLPPLGTNHVDDSWLKSDIYPAELSINLETGTIYTGDGSSIIVPNSEKSIDSGLVLQKSTSGTNKLTVTSGRATINGRNYFHTSSGTDLVLPGNSSSDYALHIVYAEPTLSQWVTVDPNETGSYTLGFDFLTIYGPNSGPGSIMEQVYGGSATIPQNAILLGAAIFYPFTSSAQVEPISVVSPENGGMVARFSPSDFTRDIVQPENNYDSSKLFLEGQLIIDRQHNTLYLAKTTFVSTDIATDNAQGNIMIVSGYGTGGLGSSGSSGKNGTSGTAGTSGSSSTSGTSGTRGTSGTAGTSGTSGTRGTSGTAGTSGTSGNTGTSGTSGSSSTSGSSGSAGTSGTRGTSGTSGISGRSGTSGTSGSSGTDGAWGGEIRMLYAGGVMTSGTPPGSGNVTVFLATQESFPPVLAGLNISKYDSYGNDLSNWMAAMDNSSSSMKGILKMSLESDPSFFWLFEANTVTVQAWGNIVLSTTLFPISGITPPAPGTPVILSFFMTGDKGDVGPNMTSLTYTEASSLVSYSSLVPGAFYEITDRGDRGIILQAVSTNEFSIYGKRKMLCPATYVQGTDMYGNKWGGGATASNPLNSVIYYTNTVWRPDDLVIWGGYVWKAIATSEGTHTINIALLNTTYFTRVEKDTFSNHEYVPRVFDIEYQFDQDWISEQRDEFGNVVGMDLDNYILSFDEGWQPCDITDWNIVTKIPGEFHDNSAYFITNNIVGGAITFNRVSGYIGNNICGDLFSNVTTGSIQGNNIGSYSLSSNVCQSISGNTNNGDIIFNSNQGVISNNSCTTIQYNRNAGTIQNNEVTGEISYNANIGFVNDNTQSVGGTIDIIYNVNNGNIGPGTRTTTISDSRTHK